MTSSAAEPARPVRQIPAKALQTTAEHPWPVRLLSTKMAEYVDRMPPVWVEGQVVQVSQRPGTTTAFLTLRDADVDFSLSVTANVRVLARLDGGLADGTRVVVHAKPTFFTRRGTLQLSADEIRPVGVGELLARIEHLKRLLASEGLLSPDRKRPLPFLPHRVGLVCGRASAAERDVVENARRRWPAVEFAVREVAVQGPNAVTEVCAAVRELDADPDVDVIVITRGGGSLEDLLPFSNETLVRVVAAAVTPVVSAIGHEVDSPVLDLVADVRASTPTDAAKLVVPDVAEESAGVAAARARVRRAVAHRVDAEQTGLDHLRSRPVLAAPTTMVDQRREEVLAACSRARTAVSARLDRAADSVVHLAAQVRALSPAATLERGYAVVQRDDGAVVRSPDDVRAGEHLRLRVAQGEVRATVDG
ncbi:exodeoxyribonuclease VII large subunit [Angustibacter sp. Root456]|uniref:exodeoxyribonuclease VII large subunit n=1 Tax=Angustibacter sp. Root456 TaxID=1736539 RepID=UPI0006FBFAAD|nr:exodeoxyribonuclease VII large subunit [Angustibacter sp. Root456]KQX69424.1 exodeoxyribonuclease VII large subunit [Angustibacter sp. Root456]